MFLELNFPIHRIQVKSKILVKRCLEMLAVMNAHSFPITITKMPDKPRILVKTVEQFLTNGYARAPKNRLNSFANQIIQRARWGWIQLQHLPEIGTDQIYRF